MPGLLRGVARVAVVAGTATAVSNRVSRRQANRWSQQGQEAPPEQDDQQSDAASPAGSDYDEKLDQLRQLGQLHDSGVLDDAEFAMQKNKILNS
jgi:hypothetical protein